jgi:hypothetical protein
MQGMKELINVSIDVPLLSATVPSGYPIFSMSNYVEGKVAYHLSKQLKAQYTFTTGTVVIRTSLKSALS